MLTFASDEAMIQQRVILAFPDLKWNSLQEVRFFNDVKLDGIVQEAHPVWGSFTHVDITGAKDLVGLCEHAEQDSFSKFVDRKVTKWFHRQVAYRFSKSLQENNPLTQYNYRTLLRSTALIVTIVACLLPILSISVLYSIKTMKARLGAIAGFNILLSVLLGVFTTAKRVEIFGVTAA
jgi:hypothetical protein